MQCMREDRRLILRPMAETALVGIGATFFVGVGMFILFSMFRQEDGSLSAAGFLPADWFGVGFLVLWTMVAGWMAYTTLYSRIGYRIVIDGNGVHEEGGLRKIKAFRWSEIRDYGYYFAGNYNFNGKTGGIYKLYFSPVQLETKNAYRKKANKEMIEIDIDEHELKAIAEEMVFPFCRQYRSFEPRTVAIKAHFM